MMSVLPVWLTTSLSEAFFKPWFQLFFADLAGCKIKIGDGVERTDPVRDTVIDLDQPGLFRAFMRLEGRGHRALDLLRGVKLVIAQRHVVVPAHQQGQDVDVILARLRPVDKEPCPGPLAQRCSDWGTEIVIVPSA